MEALGIDSAIYTRYILSLLHADVLDVIYPEDDYFLTKLKKEGNRNQLNNKRFRRSKSWRRNIDADQIKRSAAVECLMSAADQSCEIESLVDQLCEKLKEVNSESTDSIRNDDLSATIEGSMNKTVSPKELAEKYYAAFPALNQKSEPSYISTNINFVLDKWPSDKTRTDLITAKWITPDSSRKSKRKPPATMDNYNPIRRDVKRNKFGHKRTYCGRNLTRGMADNFNNWQRLCWYNENYDANIMAGRTGKNNSSDIAVETVPIASQMDDSYIKRRRVSDLEMLNGNGARRPSFAESSGTASDDEETAIKEEYDRPSFAFARCCVGNKTSYNDCSVDLNVSIDSVAFHVANYVLNDTPPQVPAQIGTASGGLLMIADRRTFYRDPVEPVEDDGRALSYSKLNHVNGCSAFCEYKPPLVTKVDKMEENEHPGYYLPNLESPIPPLLGRTSSRLEDEDIGLEMYFQPLDIEPDELDVKPQECVTKYKDGTTFQVVSDLQKVNYQKAENGCLYMKSGSTVKVYREYKEDDSNKQTANNFSIKYSIEKVDKACQTGEDMDEHSDFMLISNLYQMAQFGEVLEDLVASFKEADPEEPGDAVNSSDEVDWSCTPKSSNVFCKHCNNQHPWPGNLPNELNVGSNKRSLKEIWGGTEMCGACPWSSKPPTPLEETSSKLREESREEADKLLSDLNSLQLSNVTELKVWNSVPFQQPIKRRHSQSDNLVNDGWSFASLLQEDFLDSLPALPARRPVRL